MTPMTLRVTPRLLASINADDSNNSRVTPTTLRLRVVTARLIVSTNAGDGFYQPSDPNDPNDPSSHRSDPSSDPSADGPVVVSINRATQQPFVCVQ